MNAARPDSSIMSDELLAEVRGLPQRNVAIELLRKLLNDEIAAPGRRHLVQARSFGELLERSVRAKVSECAPVREGHSSGTIGG
jgi:type I restriction enzyme, R subunit